MKTVSEQMELARKAQAIVNDYTQEQIDEICLAIGWGRKHRQARQDGCGRNRLRQRPEQDHQAQAQGRRRAARHQGRQERGPHRTQ